MSQGRITPTSRRTIPERGCRKNQNASVGAIWKTTQKMVNVSEKAMLRGGAAEDSNTRKKRAREFSMCEDDQPEPRKEVSENKSNNDQENQTMPEAQISVDSQSVKP